MKFCMTQIKYFALQKANSKDTDKTVWVRRLVCVFAVASKKQDFLVMRPMLFPRYQDSLKNFNLSQLLHLCTQSCDCSQRNMVHRRMLQVYLGKAITNVKT